MTDLVVMGAGPPKILSDEGAMNEFRKGMQARAEETAKNAGKAIPCGDFEEIISFVKQGSEFNYELGEEQFWEIPVATIEEADMFQMFWIFREPKKDET